MFCTASIWEVAGKRGFDRPDFGVASALPREGLDDAGYEKMAIGTH